LDAAEELDRQIAALHHSDFKSTVDEFRQEMENGIRELIAGHFEIVENIKKKGEEQANDFRRQINSEFNALKARHVKELLKLEAEYAALRLKEAHRAVPECQVLHQQAKFAASSGNYEKAKEFRDEAALKNQNELAKRNARIDTEMKSHIETHFQQQRNEIETLCNKLTSGLATIEGKTTASIDQENETRDVRFIGELNKQVKKVAVLAPLGVDVSVYQREFETRMITIVEEFGLPVPKNAKKSAKVTTRASLKSPKSVRP
jgi:hypothetical protein